MTVPFGTRPAQQSPKLAVSYHLLSLLHPELLPQHNPLCNCECEPHRQRILPLERYFHQPFHLIPVNETKLLDICAGYEAREKGEKGAVMGEGYRRGEWLVKTGGLSVDHREDEEVECGGDNDGAEGIGERNKWKSGEVED